MHVFIPSSLRKLLELADSPQEDEQFAFVFVDAFLKGLAVFGISKAVLVSLRRHFEIVGAVTPDVEQGVATFERLLRRHDLLLGELGGFGGLFEAMHSAGDLYVGPTLDFESLDATLQKRLRPLGNATLEIQAADDLSTATDTSFVRVAACVCLVHISEWISISGFVERFEHVPKLASTVRLFKLRDMLSSLNAEFVASDLTFEDLRNCALWYLTHHLTRNTVFDPIKRRLVDTLLARVDLPQLAVFERAFASYA